MTPKETMFLEFAENAIESSNYHVQILIVGEELFAHGNATKVLAESPPSRK
jgi:hypothetical protein